MRRPLLAVALCLIIICAIRLWTGGAEDERDGGATAMGLAEAERLTVIGQVYQKEEDSIYLKSIVISNSNAFGQSVAESRQNYSNSKKHNIAAISLKQGDLAKGTLSGNLICEVSGAPQIPLGTTVVLQGAFAPFSGATNPGEFDACKYYRSIGIIGKLEDAVLQRQGEDCWPVREWLYGLRLCLSERIYSIFPEENAAVIEALLLGEKGNLDSELKNLYQRNGILHILSISAMHVSIVGMSIYQLLRKAGAPIWLSALCGSVVLLLYGALTGFGISAVRAIGMYLIRMLGEVVGRTYDMLTALGLVGALMVLHNPYYLQNGGFLLSFSCVLGIGVLYPLLLPDFRRYAGKNRALDTPWKKCLERLREAEFPRQIVSSFVLSLSVMLATLPVQLYLYYEVPTFSVFLNLLVVPFLKPLMMSGIAVLVLPWSVVFEGVVNTILGWYEWTCQCFDELPCNTWNPGCPKSWQIMGYYSLLFGVIWLRKMVKGKGKTISYCVVMLCLGIGILGMRPLQSNAIFLDVGQGSCVVLQLTSGENYLFDCGSTSRSRVGQYVLLPYLKYAGIRRLDGVFVSHPDEDHCSGVLELFALAEENDIVIEQLILPDIEDEASEEQMGELVNAARVTNRESVVAAARAANRESVAAVARVTNRESADAAAQAANRESVAAVGQATENVTIFRKIMEKLRGRWQEKQEVRVAYISRGDTWQCGGASFLCLHPYKDYSGADSNQYSQCVYVEFLERKWFGEAVAVQSLLLTGDVGKEAETDLVNALKEYEITEVTVFQGAHHGSKYSNSEELLDVIWPVVTVISCGRNNSYGHPHAETLERLEAVGSTVLTTPEHGAITVEFGRQMTVRGLVLSH